MNSILPTSQPVFSLFRTTLTSAILKKWVKYLLFPIFNLFSMFIAVLNQGSTDIFSPTCMDVRSPPPPWRGAARPSQLFTGPAVSPHGLRPRSAMGFSVSHCLPRPRPHYTAAFPVAHRGSRCISRECVHLNQTSHSFSYSCLLRSESVTSQPMGKLFFT